MEWLQQKLALLTPEGFPPQENSVLNSIIEGGYEDALVKNMMIAYGNAIITEQISLIASRELLTNLLQSLLHLPSEVAEPVAKHLFDALQSRAMSYFDQVSHIRMFLVEMAEKREDWLSAAEILINNDIDAGRQKTLPEINASNYMRAANLYKKCGKAEEAENCLKMAKRYFLDCKDNLSLRNTLWKTSASIMDFLGQFFEAAKKYHELYRTTALDGEQRADSFRKAIRCIMLAPISPYKERLLIQLSKDEKCLELSIYPILKKIFSRQMLSVDLLPKICEILQGYCDADCARCDVSASLRNAVMQHNLLSVAGIYDNLSITDLAYFMGTSREEALEKAIRMIGDDSIQGHIDGLKDVVYFTTDSNLEQYQKHMKQICESTNSIAESITSAHPDWAQNITSACVP